MTVWGYEAGRLQHACRAADNGFDSRVVHHVTYRKRHGGTGGGWQASYYRRRVHAEPETPAERKEREAANIASAFDDYAIQWAIEGQAAGYEGPLLTYGTSSRP